MQEIGAGEILARMNCWASEGKAYLFVINFDVSAGFCIQHHDIDPEMLLYKVGRKTNTVKSYPLPDLLALNVADPITFAKYNTIFEKVQSQIAYGNTYLLNLTIRQEIETDASLKEIFHTARSDYKLWMKDRFVVFSPEAFVQTKGEQIFTFPMKGTALAETGEVLLANGKEHSEQATIVDLMRNELSRVAGNVKVNRFRYAENINTQRGKLWMTSSEVSGRLHKGMMKKPGDMIFSLLPAGSVTGAPKEKTVQIINKVETKRRGYYCGVFGWFDGKNIDSAVLIRFIEQQNDQLFFRSGGGITAQSEVAAEYQEVLHKIYIPY